jgi:hypothetical protein
MGEKLRKSTLLIAALSSAALLVRRSRKFGPTRAFVLGALLEEVVRRLQAQEEITLPSNKPSIWARVTAAFKSSS